MDITSLLGIPIAAGTIIAGMLLEGGHMSQLWAITAVLIVFGGTLGAMMVAYPLPDMIAAVKALGIFIKNPSANPTQIMAEILDCAQTARKESILALEKKRDALSYEPLKMAIGLAVDGTAPEIIRDTLETAAHVVFEEAEVGVKFWEDFGAICPTIGILGAVLGLQHVMSVLEQPEKIGPGIAVAFVATLYGVGAANIIGIPVGKKLKRKAIIDGHARAMVIIGVEGILTGMNPKIIEQKLSVFVHDHGGDEKH
jgi:chemotaxis protein MotA